MSFQPIQPESRFQSLDIIRGFALLGIFFVNMPSFQWPDLVNQLYLLPYPYSPLDEGFRLFFDLFVQGKFYPIFSFLFGVGFYLFMEKFAEHGAVGYRFYLRRMTVLALFGFLHLFFLWYGDILLTYAVAGLLLMLFYRRKVKTILIWMGLFLSLFTGLMLLNVLLLRSVSPEELALFQEMGEKKLHEALTVYQKAPLLEWLSWRFTHEVVPYLENMFFAVLPVLFMFLIGFLAAKFGYVQRAHAHLPLLKKVIFFGIVLSLPFEAVILLTYFGHLDFGLLTTYVQQVMASISGIFLSLVYIAFLLRLLHHGKWARRLKPIGNVGRMALSNYIGQTLAGVGLYTGLGYFGQLNLALGALIVIVVFLGQIMLSGWWLNHFRFGPLEWVWRSLTYGKMQPMRK